MVLTSLFSISATCFLQMLSLVTMTTNAVDVVQIQIFVEPTVLKNWRAKTGKTVEGFEEEMDGLFVEINEVFKSLKVFKQVNIGIDLDSITYLAMDLIKKEMSNTEALETFKAAISERWWTRKYDMAVILANEIRNEGGAAWQGEICTIDGLAMVKFKGGSSDLQILAHEIGHVLGAGHDESEDVHSDCQAHHKRVMYKHYDYFPTSWNRYKFSSCSSNDIKKVLDENKQYRNGYCLQDGEPISGRRLGSLMTADEMCRRNGAEGGFVHRVYYDSVYTHMVCESLQCLDKFGRGSQVPTIPGLRCGKNKVCHLFECITSSSGNPFVLDSCPFGDQPLNGSKCHQLSAQSCSEMKGQCCFTCMEDNPIFKMTGDDACIALHGNKSALSRGKYETYGDELCTELRCITLIPGKKPQKTSDKMPDGIGCAKNKRCVSGKCVDNIHGGSDITDDTCPFGDQDLKALSYLKTCADYANEGKCGVWKKWCCKSCQGK